MKKYAVVQLNRDGSNELLEVVEAKNINDARAYATRKHIKVVTDFMNHKLMVWGYGAYKKAIFGR